MDYEYDVFISYKRGFPFGTWVHETFLPLFEPLLINALNQPTSKIFVDTNEIQAGDEWPARLKGALAKSRCLVAIWSPQYFHSKWCTYELSALLQRESQLGYRTVTKPNGLIVPVSVFDGEHFPNICQTIQSSDFRPYAIVGSGFQKTECYVDFQNEIKRWVNNVADVVKNAPEWREEWLDIPNNIDQRVIPTLSSPFAGHQPVLE